MMGNEETSQASASIEEEESVNTKLNRIIEVMEVIEGRNLESHSVDTLEIKIEKEPSNQSVPAQTQFFSTNETQLEPLNDESPASPASQQIETQVFPPNPTQHIEQEPLSNETPDAQTTTDPLTDPLTELISSIAGQYMNSDENTQVVANTPASPTSSLKLDENQNDAVAETKLNESHASPKSQQIDTEIQHVEKEPSYDTPALDTQVFTPNLTQETETETATQYFSSSEKEPSDETPSEQNQAEENLQDTTEPATETQPLNQQTKHLQTSAIDFSETEKAEENRLPTLFEIGADVEIASNEETTCRIWYPAKVVDLNGVDRVTVKFYRTVFAEKKKVQNTITTEKIRPAPPTSFQKAFEMNDNVEGFYKNGWCSGQVKMVLGDNTYSVYLNSSMETIQFEPSHLRIHREWIDGVWKMADETEESRVLTLFELGENVEIASGRKWYPGNVLKTDMLNGVEMVRVEYSTLFLDKKKNTKRLQENVSSDRIRPQQPFEKLGERLSFELMDRVEAYHNDGWCSGQVRMIFNDNTYSVSFNRSNESIKFSLSDLRIPKEWVNGVWKTTKETEESRVLTLFELDENVEIASGRKWYPGNVLKTDMLNGVEMVRVEYSTLFLDKKKKTKRLQENVSSDRIRPQQPFEKLGERLSFELMDKVEAYHNDGWCSGQVRMIFNDNTYSVSFNRSNESIKFSLSDLRIPKEWREEKRPIGPRNPPMPVTPEVIIPIDPFVTPEFPRFSRLGYWMGLRGIYCVPFYINGREKEKDFFEYMDNAENNLKEEVMN
ncbi:hypothetical protein Bca52824_017403 [Brassica carinata]|uniref:Agenet domain-containing protein n=1 Tax=Brassica carinata TaxID=52824 RepID=A0A8X7VMW4_BRACI|nr:hypothetical protein Bca52824_017403 [Brassica carinata]